MNRQTKASHSTGRFPFGENWYRFLKALNDDRIAGAEKSLCLMLQVENLGGKSFLDIGCGSGLFSLAAMRLGAQRVHSFDYDPESVICTRNLKRRHFPVADHWTIEQADVLDSAHLARLGQFDIVYSWGVLHHTGHMWQALENARTPVAAGGRLYIAIYNDQGFRSRYWKAVKRAYDRSPAFRRTIILLHSPYLLGGRFLARALMDRPAVERGMSLWCDLKDWLGGYPFEVAKPEAILEFYRKRNFQLVKLRTVGGKLGNNEYVFEACAE